MSRSAVCSILPSPPGLSTVSLHDALPISGIDGGDVRALRRRAVEDAAPMRGPDQRDRVMGGGGRLLRAASENLEEPPGLTRVAGLAAHWAAAYRHPESCTDTEEIGRASCRESAERRLGSGAR